MRALLDANILISFLLHPDRTSAAVEVVRAAVLGRFALLLPDALLGELVATCRQTKHLARRITPEETQALVEVLSAVSETVPAIEGEIPAVTRDPKDDYLLAYAVVGQADFLVTGDLDLLSLGEVGEMRIVTPAGFLQILGCVNSSGQR